MIQDEYIQREIETDDNLSGPSAPDLKIPPESMAQVLEKFQGSSVYSSKVIVPRKNQKGEIVADLQPTVYIERLQDLDKGNLNSYDEMIVDEAENLASTLQLVGRKLGLDLSICTNYFAEVGIQTVQISKSRDFALLKNIRTDRVDSLMRSEKTLHAPNVEKKRRWF